MVPATHVEGLYSCLDYPRRDLGNAVLWAAAVTEAGSLIQPDVIAALDHAQLAEGPGGSEAMGETMLPGPNDDEPPFLYLGSGPASRPRVTDDVERFVV
jgi:hypothetical protein